MALESSTTSTTSTRPSEWSYSSPDLNVLLSGHLVTPLPDTQAGAGQGQQSLEGAQFQLDTRGIYIEHPALVSITTTPTSQTLSSLNTGQPILTLSTPLLPPSTSPASSPTRTHTPTPTIITLHSPLLTRDQLASLQSSPLYSSTFHLLLDGSGFLPPKFDPHAIEPPPTPLVGPNSGQQHLLNSPTLQRALLSPLLSPQRRAHSQGSDTSVPPLSLGLSRARAPSLSGGPSSFSNRTNINTAPPPTTLATRGLEALLPPSTSRPSLDASLSSAISHAAKTTASEIMALRRSHAFYVKRAKLELHVLQTRVSNATNHAVAAPGGGLVVKGFRSASRSPGGGGGGAGETRRESLSREESRERSVERGSSEERGRARGVGGSKKDEKVSEGIRESDRREEEERGRSRSRVRRGGGGGGGERAPSKTGKAVKEVIDAAAADRAHHSSSNTSSPALSPSKSSTTTTKPLSTGQSISAFIDDSAPSSPTTTTTTATSSSQPIPVATEEDDDAIEEEDAASPMFVPSSHALVSIPETEELSLPASEIGDEEEEEEEAENEDEERKEEERARQGSALSGSEESSEEETDHPFEMDEDLDVDPLTLTFSSPSPPSFDAPTPSAPAPAPAQPTNTSTSTSFRPGSLARPSTLSASYNALLSSSLSSRPSHSPSLPPPSTSPYGTHPTSTSFTEDVQTALDFIPQPDRQAARVGEEKIREVLAMDAPSHRRVLPSRRWAAGRRRRRGSSGGAFDEVEESDEEQEQEQEHEHEDRTSRMEIGSLPISIGFARPQPSSSFRPPGERELMRKTSVPGREGMFVPPLLNPKTKAPVLGGLTRRKSGKKDKEEEVGPEQGSKASQSHSQSQSLSQAHPTTPQAQAMPLPSPSSKIDVTPSSTSSSQSGAALSSSLAQSLRAHPSQAGGVRSFSQVVEEEEAEEASTTPSKTGSEGDGEEGEGEEGEEGEDFVPPHEFVLRGRRDEEMLSRSVTSY